MEKNWGDPSEQILNLTLEIIFLLTGENYFVVKKPGGKATNNTLQVVEEAWKAQTGGQMAFPKNKQKILDLTNKMTELLTEEVPIRCQDVAVYLSMEEWEYIEGHRDLYQDTMTMDDHQPLTVPGLPNPPMQIKKEQSENITNPNISTPTDHIRLNRPSIKEEPISSEEANLTKPPQQHPVVHIEEEPFSCDVAILPDPDIYTRQYPCTAIKEEPSSCDGGNFEGQKNPLLDQAHQYLVSQVKDEQEEETLASPTIYPIEDHTQQCSSAHVNEKPFPSSEENIIGNAQHHPSTPVKKGMDVADAGPPVTQSGTNDISVQFSCPECKKCFPSMAEWVSHQGIHIAEKFFQSSTHVFTTAFVLTPQEPPVKHKLLKCSKCERTFYTKSSLVGHMKTHWRYNNENFKCGQCGKFFSSEAFLNWHSRLHCGERPYACNTCGDRFWRTSDLCRHQRKH